MESNILTVDSFDEDAFKDVTAFFVYVDFNKMSAPPAAFRKIAGMQKL